MGTVYIPRLLLVGGSSEMNKAPGLHVLLKVRIDKTSPMLRTAVVSCTQATVAFFNTCTRWVRIPVAKASCRAHRYINNYVNRLQHGYNGDRKLVRSRSRYRRFSSYVKYRVITKRRSKGRSHGTSGPSLPTVELVRTCCWQPKCPHAPTAPGCRRLLRKRAGLRSGSVPSRTSVVRLAGFGRLWTQVLCGRAASVFFPGPRGRREDESPCLGWSRRLRAASFLDAQQTDSPGLGYGNTVGARFLSTVRGAWLFPTLRDLSNGGECRVGRYQNRFQRNVLSSW